MADKQLQQGLTQARETVTIEALRLTWAPGPP